MVTQQLDLNHYAILLNLRGEARAKAIAINLSACSTGDMTKSLFSHIYTTAGIKNKCFSQEGADKKWFFEQMTD